MVYTVYRSVFQKILTFNFIKYFFLLSPIFKENKTVSRFALGSNYDVKSFD